MIADYATTGLTVERHPLRLLRDGLRRSGTVTSADLSTLPHGARVEVGGLVVARQRPGTAKGVVFLLLEDETGTVNLIVPPAVYERDRLTVRTEPLVIVTGTLERHASAGGAINVLVDRVVPLDAPELLDERPAAQVKDFSLLDARELARVVGEQAVAAAAASGGAVGGGDGGAAGGLAAHAPVATGAGPPRLATSGRLDSTAGTERPAVGAGRRPHRDEDEELAGPGADDFRAVAPPVMSFAQGRRR